MGQTRLNHCIVLHVLKDRTDTLDNKEIAKEFIEEMSDAKTILDSHNSHCMHVAMFLI